MSFQTDASPSWRQEPFCLTQLRACLLLAGFPHTRVALFFVFFDFLLGVCLYWGKTDFGAFSASSCGPVRWEAPESLRLKQYSEATDAFMFGVSLWEMVAGQVPWHPLPTAAAAHAVKNSGSAARRRPRTLLFASPP